MSRYACTPRSACLGIALTMSIGLAITTPSTAQDEKRYDTGASDTTIKIGNTAPYSGPLSSNGTIAKTEGAYFRMINDQGGINGRKIEFISYDDAYSPPKTVEQTRKLIESDEVLFLFNQLGTPTTMSVIKYVNAKKIPQLFIEKERLYFAEHRHVRPAKDLARSLVASGRSAQREASRVQRLKLIFNCLSSATR
jgi:branched-chain amino acid transport system substrate-binding protein